MGKTRRRKNTAKRKRCPNGTRRNKKTAKCQKKKKHRKSKFFKSRMKKLIPVKTIKLKSRTPELNLLMRESVKNTVSKDIKDIKRKSYSPSINKALDSLKSLTPEGDLFSCEEGEIKVKTKSGYTCKDFEDDAEEVERILLRNLNIKDSKINFLNVIAPKQELSNCWFNCYFMNFFISDKGRKFFRYFRTMMITGKKMNGDNIDEDFKLPFWLLNTYIEASLVGKRDPNRFAETMDTNDLIYYLGLELKKKKLKVPSMGEMGNPIAFYKNIMAYLDNNTHSLHFLIKEDMRESFMKIILERLEKIPKILLVLTGDGPLKLKYKLNIHDKTIYYRLDSAIISSLNGKHWTSCITGNGREYGFDGASFSRLIPFDWKEKINTDISWKYIDISTNTYNFKTNRVFYFYYRS